MRRPVLLAAISLSLSTVTAQAQDAGPSAPVDRSLDVTTLDGTTVTARRREEDLQKIPVVVSVVDGELLDRSYTVNTQQLSQLVPSLYYNSANPRNTAYTIRGLGSNTLPD